MTYIFERYESDVRSYCRSFPAVFSSAKNAVIVDEQGKEYIDLFSGAGSLNYGHNPEGIKLALLDYIKSDGIIQSLDLHTTRKRAFIEGFTKKILEPRGLEYRLMFCGPTGANAVELALKVARKATGRTVVGSFTNGYHGMSLGALAATGSANKRSAAGTPLNDIDRYAYDGYFGKDVDTIEMARMLLADASSGYNQPAAFIVECIQGEGGLRAASNRWLKDLATLAAENESLLIVDDIQAGCGRTGDFFSFERAGLKPDIICLSKSLSGYGLPFSLVLVKPEFDLLKPGEHNGTFRGFNLAFLSAEKAIDYWSDEEFLKNIQTISAVIEKWIKDISLRFPSLINSERGRGLMAGLVLNGDGAKRVSSKAFECGVLVETSGANDEVLKFFPPLTIEKSTLIEALNIIEHAIEVVG
ncbi:diaminobutyrate--2-oxoglutarate transaminase [Roseibium sp. M-1]